MEEGNPITGIAMILILLLLNVVFTAVKAAFDNVNESSVKKKAESGDIKAARLVKLLEKPNGYLISFELLLTFANILIGAIYSRYILNHLEKWLMVSPITLDQEIVKNGLFVLITVIMVFLITLLGHVLPGKLATKHAEIFSYQVTGLIRLFGFLLRPLTWLLEKVQNMILYVFGIKPHELEDNVTEEEFMSMVNEGHEQGIFDAGEVEMISNIIELDEKEAQDIMTPKKKIIAVNAEMSVEEALKFMLSENYSRYPLYEENRDNIIGILHLKDVIIAYISTQLREKPLRDIARDAYFVPDTQNINILFHEMQSKNIHMAIVIDEYGQTAGLVAMEDFLEEIVGNIQDEYDQEEKLILSSEEGNIEVKGAISLEELEEELDITIVHEDFDTLNGLLISLLDRIPGDGEQATLDYEGYRFDILETRNKMIERVRISKLPEDTDAINAAENI